ncbi:MAG: diguanylate cyclase [Acidobacteriota bacterium]
MSRRLKFYDLLDRLPFALSFRSKAWLAALISFLVPLAAMLIYLGSLSGLRQQDRSELTTAVFLVAVCGSLLAYWTITSVLRPVFYVASQLKLFLDHHGPSDLPIHYRDEVGCLMANVNELTRSLREVLAYSTQTSLLDHLTGVYNRRSVEERLRDSIELCRIRQTTISLAVIDIDHFKTLNDSRGHAFGDAVLRQIADLLRTNLRRTDWIGRWGGDEFVILIQGSEPEALALLSRMQELARLKVIVAPDQSVHKITFSCGVCEWRDTMDAASLFARADAALYAAKHGGRDQLQVFQEVTAAAAAAGALTPRRVRI